MANFTLSKSRIAAIHATIPSGTKELGDEVEKYGGNPVQIEKIKKAFNLERRHVVTDLTTASDLCMTSLEALLRSMSVVEPNEVGALICVTQTPDHFQPCNASVLHGKLGLSKDCAAFDINLGCSGFVYGLCVAQCLIECGDLNHVLLAVGDTLSRCVGERDRSVAPLFGDAGAAVLVSRSLKATNSYFSLSADGAGADYIKVPAGGFRLPKSEQTSRIETDTHGNSRSLENLYMDGAQVFSFSIGTVPGSIDETFERFGVNKEEIDFFFLHQANDYIVSNISKRIGAPPERVPKGIVSEFGNLSSASIPVTICKTFEASRPLTPCKVLLSGFGVGLSWANCITHLDDVVIGLSVS